MAAKRGQADSSLNPSETVIGTTMASANEIKNASTRPKSSRSRRRRRRRSQKGQTSAAQSSNTVNESSSPGPSAGSLTSESAKAPTTQQPKGQLRMHQKPANSSPKAPPKSASRTGQGLTKQNESKSKGKAPELANGQKQKRNAQGSIGQG